MKKTAAEASKARAKASGERKSVGSDPSASSSASPAGWWRPLFPASVPAAALAASSLGGVAVESPVWLLGPEGCAVESRRSLAKLLGIRGRAAVRWQEAVSGATGRIAVGPGRAGRVTESPRRGRGGGGRERRERRDVSRRRGRGEELGSVARTATPPTRGHRSRSLRPRRVQRVQHGDLLRVFGVARRGGGRPGSVDARRGRAESSRRTRRARRHGHVGTKAAPLGIVRGYGGVARVAALSSALTPGEAVASFCAVPAPEATSGLPCVTCDTLAAICSDLPSPELGGAVRQLEPLRTVALPPYRARTLFSSLARDRCLGCCITRCFPRGSERAPPPCARRSITPPTPSSARRFYPSSRRWDSRERTRCTRVVRHGVRLREHVRVRDERAGAPGHRGGHGRARERDAVERRSSPSGGEGEHTGRRFDARRRPYAGKDAKIRRARRVVERRARKDARAAARASRASTRAREQTTRKTPRRGDDATSSRRKRCVRPQVQMTRYRYVRVPSSRREYSL